MKRIQSRSHKWQVFSSECNASSTRLLTAFWQIKRHHVQVKRRRTLLTRQNYAEYAIVELKLKLTHMAQLDLILPFAQVHPLNQTGMPHLFRANYKLNYFFNNILIGLASSHTTHCSSPLFKRLLRLREINWITTLLRLLKVFQLNHLFFREYARETVQHWLKNLNVALTYNIHNMFTWDVAVH